MMDNYEDKTEGKMDPRTEKPQNHTDSNVQSSDKFDNLNEQIQPSQSMVSVNKHIPIAKLNMPPQHLFGVQDQSQVIPSGSDIKELMFRYKWTIIILSILVAIPLIFAIWTQIVPKYQARAELRVQPIIPRLVFETEDNGMIPLYNSFANTQVSIIRSLTILQRVLDQREIQETHWYQNPSKSLIQRLRGTPISALERLRNDLSAQPRNNTEIIDISLTAEKANDCKIIVDAVLKEYLKYIQEMSDATEDNLYRQLVDQYDALENEIIGREQVTAEIRKSLGTATPDELILNKRMRLDEIQAQISRVQQNIALLEEYTKQVFSEGVNDLTEEQIKYSEDDEWRQLDLNVKAIRHNIDNSILTDKHPDMIRMKNDLKFAEELLKYREAQIEEQLLNSTTNISEELITVTDTTGNSQQVNPLYLRQQLARLKYEEELLNEELDKQKEDFEEVFANAQLLEEENNTLTHKRELFSTVRQRLEEKNIERNVPGSIDVLMWAFVPSQPYNDRRIVFTAMSIFFSLCIGGGVAYLMAIKNQTVYTPKDMLLPDRVPFLGYIPLVNLKKPIGSAICKEISQKQFMLNESFRVVRTILLSRLNGKNCTTLLVSSATTGTGKSTITMMLGKSLTYTGKKVLVIDADLKKMTLSKLYKGMPNNSGFVKALRDPTRYEEHIFRIDNVDLDFMPAGNSNDETVTEEIANGAFKILMEELNTRYDIILLDSSPILPVADSIILSNQVDGTIFVEREHISNRTEIVDAVKRISATHGKLVGSVFVGSKTSSSYYNNYM